MKFNLNHKVRVKLTERGREVMTINHRKLWGEFRAEIVPVREVKEDAEGWSEWQLWDLMHEFGAHCYNGCRVPFETEIEIIEGQ